MGTYLNPGNDGFREIYCRGGSVSEGRGTALRKGDCGCGVSAEAEINAPGADLSQGQLVAEKGKYRQMFQNQAE